MKFAAIIPARYNSTRLPGKPLAQIGDHTLIMRVYQQCKKVEEFVEVIVATDDKRIYNHVTDNGGKAIMTSESHESGTERCAEVSEGLGDDIDFIINVQGDEPFIKPEQITDLINTCSKDIEIATLVKEITQSNELFDESIPKVVTNEKSHALYFSRSVIPHLREVEKERWTEQNVFMKHIGIYAYRRDILATIVKLPPSLLEKHEQLEQLRWLSHGFSITVTETKLESMSVDTPNDLEKAREIALSE